MTDPTLYRKRPVVIEAMEWDGTAESARQVIDWVLSHGGTVRYACGDEKGCSAEVGVHWLEIETLEGTHRATPGDQVIRGIANEFYPCKPAIFVDTYETAPDGATRTHNH